MLGGKRVNLKATFGLSNYSRRFSAASGLSLLGHGIILLVLLLPLNPAAPRKTVSVVPLTAQDLQQLKMKIAAQEAKQEVKKILPKHQQQIVNTTELGRKEKPQDDYFLGKTNQTFQRQTAARRNGPFSPGALGEAGSPKKMVLDPKKLGLGQNLFAPKMPKTAQAKTPGTQQGDPQAVGPAASSDFIENLPLGDFAQLNTQEFKYFGFYDRIRQKLEMFWGVALREKAQSLSRQGRYIASGQRITGLQVLLDRQGNIIKVLVKAASGVRELDEAAVESFRKAGPFPNPPQGMIKGGYALIEWGFVVKS